MDGKLHTTNFLLHSSKAALRASYASFRRTEKEKMVVIELETSEEKTANPPKTAANEDRRQATEVFKTASDRELSDHHQHDGAANRGHNGPDQQQQQLENGPINDEIKQNALAQANDAKLEGNKLFGDGQYEEALSRYKLALEVAPEMPSSADIRSICLANRGTCFLKLGRYEDTIKECTKALELNPVYVKALVRRGEAHEKLEHFEEAIADMKKILEIDSSNDQARKVIRHLEPLAAEKREKMKEEMIAKLKDMGNSLLGRFGMSIDNFKAVKDPKTGSYSISFQQ